MARILCVEDEPDIAELIKYNVERAGHECRIASDGRAALEMAKEFAPDLITLDLMLPRLDGIQVCRQLRSEPDTRGVAILMLTAKGEEADVVGGLEAGGDDYLTKPFSPRELVARISSLLRRTKPDEDESKIVRYPGLTISTVSHEVTLDGELIKLTLSEFRLLWHLARNPDRVFTRSQLLDRVAGREAFIIDRNVDVHVRGLRKKLGPWAAAICTVRGIGYKFSPKDGPGGEDAESGDES